MHTVRRAASAACAALALLAACASVPPATTQLPSAPVVIDTSFDAAGRLSARRGDEAVAVHFTWRHASGSDVFDVATPLGQTVARMQRDGNGVRVERPGESTRQYPTWAALTTAVLGVAIPVDGLVSWIQAAPADARADIERDAAGRPLVLREQGWEIVYTYAEGGRRPTRLVMRYPGSEGVEVRIVVDRWSTPS